MAIKPHSIYSFTFFMWHEWATVLYSCLVYKQRNIVTWHCVRIFRLISMYIYLLSYCICMVAHLCHTKKVKKYIECCFIAIDGILSPLKAFYRPYCNGILSPLRAFYRPYCNGVLSPLRVFYCHWGHSTPQVQGFQGYSTPHKASWPARAPDLGVQQYPSQASWPGRNS